MEFFGMAGLAEAAFAFGALMVIAALGASVLMILIALWKKSKIALGFAALLWLGTGWLLQPWHAFDGPQSPNDPDEIYWIHVYRGLIVAWLSTVFLAGILFVRYRNKRSAIRPSPNSASTSL